MTIYTYEKLTHYATAKTKSGKRRQKTFWQTLSPFNKNPDGSVKDRKDVFRSLREEAAAWQLAIAEQD